MISFDERIINERVDGNELLLLVADIGGTNSTFGVYQEHGNRQELLYILHTYSIHITDFTEVVIAVLEKLRRRYKPEVNCICIGAAGMLNDARDQVKLTNRQIIIDVKDLQLATHISSIFLVNDFEVLGYGLDAVSKENLVIINKGYVRPYAHRAFIGAGTGLGKSISYWNESAGCYVTLASEGGHADCCVQNQLDLDLINFIHKAESRTCNISWEDLLSGRGIQRMYHFFKHRNNNIPSNKQLWLNGPHPDEIFNSRNLDQHAYATYELYATLYARCIKNFALDALSLGGIYVTGGIATHNVAMFKEPLFLKEFINCGKQQELLKTIPLTIIADYYVNLYGAAKYARLKTKKF